MRIWIAFAVTPVLLAAAWAPLLIDWDAKDHNAPGAESGALAPWNQLSPQSTPGQNVVAALEAGLGQSLSVDAGTCPRLAQAVGVYMERLGMASDAEVPSLPDEVDGALGCLLDAVNAANAAHDEVFHDLTRADRLALFEAQESPSDALWALVEGRDQQPLVDAAAQMAMRVDEAIELFSLLDTRLAPIPPVDLAPVIRFEPSGSQVYDANYALIVDLEGDDVYDNNVGGVIAQVGAGIYDVEGGSEAVHVPGPLGSNVGVGGRTQDSDAVLSAGLGLDLAGNDVYGVKHAPMLKDAANGCAGEDVVPWIAAQGGGIVGIGMLFDLAGDNTYVGRTQSQGAGHIMGVGVLYTGPGEDSFEAIRAAQGSGLLGGIGILIDEAGASTYRTHVPPLGVWNGDLAICDMTDRYAQGSSFDRRAGPLLHGVGILWDQGGNDSYEAGSLVQGFGQGIGFALLLDEEGNDSYVALDKGQGMAQGRSSDFNQQAPPGGGVGILVDRSGDDSYTIGSQGQGYALGDPVNNPPPTDPVDLILWIPDRDEAFALLLDESGSDSYSQSGRGDGATVTEGVLGIFVDRA